MDKYSMLTGDMLYNIGGLAYCIQRYLCVYVRMRERAHTHTHTHTLAVCLV